MPTMEDARAVLKRHFGYDDFRRGQVDVVASVLAGRDTLGVLPTGGGKSLCYQVPALVLPGLTVVISPLISLMKDQVDRLDRLGIPATFLNSTLDAHDVSARLARAQRGALKLLYVAPERFEAAELQRCLGTCDVRLLAVDEAHCVSEWGHEFRPSFRRIASVRAKLRVPQTMALTATATPAVRADIVRQLGLREPAVVVAGFDRTNLHYAVRQCRDDAEKNVALLHTLTTRERPAIVYASTRSTVERVAKLVSRRGIPAFPYHGGLDPAHRQEVQEAFMAGAVDCMVATSAFGMGIDKPNVRLVVHYAMPGTLEAYYQEAGRAGRDGLPGQCVLLHSSGDRLTHEWFIRGMFPDRRTVERTYASLQARQADGHAVAPPTDRVAQSSLRILEREGVVARQRPDAMRLRVRLMATPARIRRELHPPSSATDLQVLRALWRLAGDRLSAGIVVDLTTLPPMLRGRKARDSLERMRDRQLVHLAPVGGGMTLTRPRSPLDAFHIPWDALVARASAERSKLEAMEAYTRTSTCRRAFVLRYFGERATPARCSGCDNCLRT